MEFPSFNQRQYPEELGVGVGYNIADYGCALVCVTAICKYFGKEVNPSSLNQSLIQVNGFFDNGTGAKTLLIWGAISQVFPDIKLAAVNRYANVPADINLIDSYLLKNVPLVVGVDFNHRPTQQEPTHFVTIFAKNPDGTYECMDPWTGEKTNFNARFCVNGMTPAQAILQIVTYTFSGVASTQTPEMNKLVEELRKARDDNYAMFQAEALKNAELAKTMTDQRQAAEAQLQDYKQRLAEAEDKVTKYYDENKGLTIQIKQINEQNANISALYKAKCEEDATAIDKGIKTQKQLEEYLDFIKNISNILDLHIDPTKPEFDKIIGEVNMLLRVKRDTFKNLVSPMSDFFERIGFTWKK